MLIKEQPFVGDVLQKVLMVRPDHFDILYQINPWMGGLVDKEKAFEQWNALKKGVEDAGLKVEVMNDVEGLPDMVFACNSGLTYCDEMGNKKFYLARNRTKERQGEERYFLKYFKDMGLEIWGDDNLDTFEGGGDCFFTNYRTLFAGCGPRSSKKVYEKIRKMGKFDIIYCELVSPWFYHIDTCMCPINPTTIMWYPPALSEKSQVEIRRHAPNSIEITQEEAFKFVCNSLVVKRTMISPIGMSGVTKKKLADRGYTVKEFDMSEFMKAGGACKCCIMKLF